MNKPRTRANGEGSIYPYKNGFAAYAWVEKPDGTRDRKYVYGKTRDEVHDKWLELHRKAKEGPVATRGLTLGKYMVYWLEEVVRPHKSPGTYANYEMFARLYLIPALGNKRLDRLRTRELQTWINKVARTCQCCWQGKDAKRPDVDRKCCAKEPRKCCHGYPSSHTLTGIRTTLRAVWNHAKKTGEVTGNNPVSNVELSDSRRKRQNWWTSEEAGKFLYHSKSHSDPMYAAYVLILVLGLRRGEALGLTWDHVDFIQRELIVEFQLQRVRQELLHRETKTPGSMAVLPLPDICLSALEYQKHRQQQMAVQAGRAWHDTNLVFTTRYGLPIEPRNFNRSFHTRCERAGIRRIKVHDARRTCASILADLDVHPRIAMQVLRHAKFSMTMEIYTEVSSKTTRQALKRLGKALEQ